MSEIRGGGWGSYLVFQGSICARNPLGSAGVHFLDFSDQARAPVGSEGWRDFRGGNRKSAGWSTERIFQRFSAHQTKQREEITIERAEHAGAAIGHGVNKRNGRTGHNAIGEVVEALVALGNANRIGERVRFAAEVDGVLRELLAHLQAEMRAGKCISAVTDDHWG